MKLQIRTKDDLEKLKTQGISYAWRINKSRLNSIAEVEIYNFSGSEKIVGIYDPTNTKVLTNGRVAVAFINGKIESCDFKWIGQYPIKYKSSENSVLELEEDEKVDAEEELKMTEIEKIADGLKNNFLFQASLGSKELFHSNMLAWILEQKNKKGKDGEFEVLSHFIKTVAKVDIEIITEENTPMIAREENKIDLTIKWKKGDDWNFIFIENKIKSIPTKEQLDEYDKKIPKIVAESTKKIKGKKRVAENEIKVDRKPHKFLLTPFFSEVNSDSNDWKKITYSEEIINFLKEIKDFKFNKADETNIKIVIEKYISFLTIQNEILTYLNLDNSKCFKNRYYDFYSKNMIQNDDEIDELISVEEQDEKHYMSHVRSLRLHDLVLKLAHSNLLNLLNEEFNKPNKHGHLKEIYKYHENFTNSTGLTSVITRLYERKNNQIIDEFIDIGVQLQGNQFRYFLNSNLKEVNFELAKCLFNERIWFHNVSTPKPILGKGRSKNEFIDSEGLPRTFCEYSNGAFLYFYEDIYQDDKIPSIDEIIHKFKETFEHYESKKTEIDDILKKILKQ